MRSQGHARSLARLWILLALALAAGTGCAPRRTGQVTPVSNREVIALTADDTVRLMQRAGFSEEQVLEFGTDLRNALATTGAVQIRIADKVEAIFAVDGEYVYGSSRRRGSFVYEPRTGAFR